MEMAAKIVWFVLLGTFALGGWVTKIQITQSNHEDELVEQKSDIKKVSENVNYIKGWVEAQPQPKRR